MESVRRRHEVCAGGTRAAPTVQIVGVHESPLQSQVAVLELCERRASVQGRSARVSRVVRAVRYAMAKRERRCILRISTRCL